MRHCFSDTISDLVRQLNAFWNSFELANAPLTRKRFGVCESSFNDVIIHDVVCVSHKLYFQKKKKQFLEIFTSDCGMWITYMTKRYKKQLIMGNVFKAR